MNVCLGPYHIKTPHFKNEGDANTFVNPFETRQIAVTTIKGVNKPPAIDAELMHEVLGEEFDTRWYECPSQKGRVYTIMPTACEVLISSFENGLDGDTSFGAGKYCFGKVYIKDKEPTDSGETCYTLFEFDGHLFQVRGTTSINSGEYDCDECSNDLSEVEKFDTETGTFGYKDYNRKNENTSLDYRIKTCDEVSPNEKQLSTLGIDDATSPSPDPPEWSTPPYATGRTSIRMISQQAFDTSGVEYRFDCPTDSTKSSGWQASRSYSATGLTAATQYGFKVQARDISDNYNETGFSEESWATTFGGTGVTDSGIIGAPSLEDCESQDDPQVLVRPSGDSITAYTYKDEDGASQIKLYLGPTSQTNMILYYRELSRGCLLNQNEDEFVVVNFEIYDDLVIPAAITAIGIGFLSGPLSGMVFHVNSIERGFQPSGLPKQTLSISASSNELSFEDSNNVCDVEWYLFDESLAPFSTSTPTVFSASLPTEFKKTTPQITLMDLPCYELGGTEVEEDVIHKFVGNHIKLDEDKVLTEIRMQFQVDEPTLAFWYVWESTQSWWHNCVMQKVTTITDTVMTTHSSGEFYQHLLADKYYVIGVILKYPRVTYRKESSDDVIAYHSGQLPGWIYKSHQKDYIMPPFYSVDIKGWYWEAGNATPRYWQLLCWDEEYTGDNTPGPPDGSFETGVFQLGTPEPEDDTDTDKDEFCFYGNTFSPRPKYSAGTIVDTNKWLNKYEQYIRANVGQKLYFAIYDNTPDHAIDNDVAPIWTKVVIADSDEPKWYSSGDINLEMEMGNDYILGVGQREWQHQPTWSETEFYHISMTGPYESMFFGYRWHAVKKDHMIALPDWAFPKNTGDSNRLYLQKLTIGSDDDSTMDAPVFALEREWISTGAASGYVGVARRGYGETFRFTGNSTYRPPDPGHIKNFKAWLKVPSGYVNPEVFFYIMSYHGNWRVFWESGPRQISIPLGDGFEGYVYASDLDIDLQIDWDVLSWMACVAWGNIPIEIGKNDNETSLYSPYATLFQGYVSTYEPPYAGDEDILFNSCSNHVVVDIEFSNTAAPPETLAACCFPSSVCQNLTQEECENAGAVWHQGEDCGSGFSCVIVPTGACCHAPTRGDIYLPPVCEVLSEEQCHAAGAFGVGLTNSTYRGDGTTCGPSSCLLGACCLDISTCSNLAYADCMSQEGIWRWPGSQCDQLMLSNTECDTYTTGACCVAITIEPHGCIDVDQTTCDLFGTYKMDWAGSGTRCSQIDCAIAGLGACCYGNAQCELLSELDCVISHSEDGEWQGEFTTCSEDLCVHRGICCLSDNSCVFTTQVDCENQGGTYRQDGGSCVGYSCTESRGACCLPNGYCEADFTQDNCETNSGTYLGDDTTCAGVECVIQTDIGACCLIDGTCFVGTRIDCEASLIESEYQGDGTFCSGSSAVECPVIKLTSEEALVLPSHTYLGKTVPSSKPSVTVAKNHFMIDGSQHQFVSYQAFENNQWNIYLRQVRTVLNNQDSSDPNYQAPFNILERPSFTLAPLQDSDFTQVQYTVVNSTITVTPGNDLCAMFKVTLPDGRCAYNCDEESSGEWTTIHPYGGAVPFPTTEVYVEAIYDINTCGLGFSKWALGSTFQGSFPPTPDDLGDEESGCVSISALYPAVDEWCHLQSNCVQTQLIDDPLCPSPYLGVTYKPSDLWLLQNGDDIVTRVKYNLGINILALTSETLTSGSGISGSVDFMFVIDYSSSMLPRINAVRNAITPFAQDLKNAGIDVRFGLCIYGRADSSENSMVTPSQPANAVICPDVTSVGNQAMFDGLTGFASGGFTTDVSALSVALNHWFYDKGAQAPGYSSIQFVSLDPRFEWRSNAARYIMLITDAHDHENNAVCTSYSNTSGDAISVITNEAAGTNASVILSICDAVDDTGCKDGTGYLSMSKASDWDSDVYFDVKGPYDLAFQSIFAKITTDLLQSTVMERDQPGFDPTFLKPAEILITYDGDLTDHWTQDKHLLSFVDNPPSTEGSTKGLVNIPFKLANSTYGIDTVHLNGHWENWVHFLESGNLLLDWPNIGTPSISRSNAVQLASNAINSKVVTNKRNELFVAYESLEFGTNQIVIKGTGDFAQDSVTGPRGSRLTRFFERRDFAYEHMITLPGEGVNQLCDLVVDNNDVIHVVWQSSRDTYWEIYYANGKNLFEPVRVTSAESRSGHPAIDIDTDGNIFVVYHDNRYGPFEIMMSYKNEKRVLPLLQQDAYLGGLRSGYEHYTNILPILVENPQELTPIPGQLWGARAKCAGARFDLISRKSLRHGWQTTTNPFGGHQINETSDLPAIGNKVYIEIWATTIDGDGFGPIAVDFQYNSSYFSNPVIRGDTESSYGRWYNSPHPPEVNPSTGIIINLGGSSDPDQLLIAPYWGMVASIELTLAALPTEEISFSVADTLNPSNGLSLGITNSIGEEITDVSYDTIYLTSNSNRHKEEYACLHPSNFLFDVDEETAMIGEYVDGIRQWRHGGGNIEDYKISAIAGSTMGDFYGVTTSGLLLHMSSRTNDPYVYIEPSGIDEVGTINLPLDNYVITDATVDTQSFHLWVMLAGVDDLGASNILVMEVDPLTANTVRESTVYVNLDELRGSITCTSGGEFHMITYRSDRIIYSSAEFPVLGSTSAVFDFDDVNDNVGDSLDGTFVTDFTADYADTIYVVDDDLVLYSIERDSGVVTKIDVITDPDDLMTSHSVLMLSSMGGLGYQFTGKYSNIADAKYFNVLIEFYDNKNLEGDPSIVIDSRENSEAFINDRTFQSEYMTDEYESSARGIQLAAGETGYMFFEAAHYRPGYINLGYPYGFEKNKAYFPKAFSVDTLGNVQEVTSTQTVTFSCGKCSATSDNSFDSGGCSYSFIVTNNTFEAKYFNFKVDFYADEDRKSIVRRFELLPGHDDLAYCEVDNQAADPLWTSKGLLLQPNDVKFVQVYPALDPSAGFLCGISYHMRVLSCTSDTGVCSDEEFSVTFSDAEWDQSSLADNLSNDDQSTDITQIGDKLAIAYRDSSGYLKYGVFDGLKWVIETVDVCNGYGVSLAEFDGQPALVYTYDVDLRYAVKDRLTKEWDIITITQRALYQMRAPNLVSYNDGTLAVAYWSSEPGINVLLYAYSDTGFAWTNEIVEVTTTGWSLRSEIGHAFINGKPRLTFANGDNWYYYTKSDGAWTGKAITVNGTTTRFVNLISYNDAPFITYREDYNGSRGFLRWAISDDDGDSWSQNNVLDGIENGVGEYVDLKLVKGKPAAVYCNYNSPYNIKFAREIDLSKNRWDITVVDEDTQWTNGNPRDVRKSLADFNQQAAVFAPIDPARVYLSDPERVISGIKPTYFCECSSTIFGDDQLLPLSEIGKWKSSGHGYADTRLTETPGDTLRPDIVVRHTESAIITFEDHSGAEPAIKATSFTAATDEAFGSGTRNWYDFDPGLIGKNVSADLDFNQLIEIAFERQVKESTFKSQLPTNQVLLSSYDYRITDNRGAAGAGPGPGVSSDRCNIEELENNIISSDPFLSNQVVKQVRVREEFVQYFTYNSQGKPTPVVNACEIGIEIVGTPEVIAVRTRNSEGAVSSWCSWNPLVGDYTTKMPYTLTRGSGEKEICIQAMTYDGVTTEFCVPVYADYKKIIFEIKLYSDSGYAEALTQYDGFYVASITDNEGTVGTDGKLYKTVYIEIIPGELVPATTISFDVIQQGVGDVLNQPAVWIDEKQVYQGEFRIYKEDNVINIDGMSRIRAKLPGACEEVQEAVITTGTFARDVYNTMTDKPSQSVEQTEEDVFASQRDTITGRLGMDIVVRPNDDPFLIFGDPNYSFKKDEGVEQPGIMPNEDEDE